MALNSQKYNMKVLKRMSFNMNCSKLLLKQQELQYAISDVATSSPPNKLGNRHSVRSTNNCDILLYWTVTHSPEF